MKLNGISHGSRLVSVILAIGVHAAAAAAFMLTPKMEPPPPPEGVEIEMLAEITSVVAEETRPSVAAEAEAVQEATEAQPGEAASMDGELVEEMAALDREQTEVAPDAIEEIQKPQDQPEAEKPTEAETMPDAETPEAETPTPEAEKPEAETPEAVTPEAVTPEVETPEAETDDN